MKCIITGSTGFVGRNLLLRVLSEGKYERIYLPVRNPEKLRAQLMGDGFDAVPSHVVPIQGSTQAWNVSTLEVDHVIHCASGMFERSREAFFQTNVEGTLRLFDELKGNPRTIVLSSLAASGPNREAQEQIDEKDGERPITLYGESKLAMERALLKDFPNRQFVVLRPSAVFGARDQASLPLFKMVKSPLRFKPGMKPKFYTFISVDDLVSAIVKVISSTEDWCRWPHRIFFVGSEKPVTDREIMDAAGRAVGRSGMTVKVPQSFVKLLSNVLEAVPLWREAIPSLSPERYKDLECERWVISSDRFRSYFEWKPIQTIDSTLKATADWYSRTGQL